MTPGKIIVSGILAWYPLAGVTFQFLHYMLGLKRLGYDPYYVEDSSRWVYSPRLRQFTPDVTENLAAIVPVLAIPLEAVAVPTFRTGQASRTVRAATRVQG